MSNNAVAYVVGSGPAAVSAAKGLLARGRQVVMLDGGRELEADRASRVSRMASVEPEAWSDDDITALKQGFEVTSSGAKEKKVFGSSYANLSSRHFPISKENSQFYLSFAKGGLSNLWGRGILPLCEDDRDDWPVSLEVLADHYKKVLEYVPIAGQHDDLASLYPVYTEKIQEYRISSQSDKLLAHLKKNQAGLKKQGVYAGTTRLAAKMSECRYCGMCMYGCPYGLLYSSAQTVDELLGHESFSYRKNTIVSHVEEKGDSVIVHAFDEETGEALRFCGDKVFIGAGSIATTRIMLESLNLYDSPVTIKCSDMYYMPAFSWRRSPGITHEKLFTLSQLMLEIHNPGLSDRIISTHLHGYSDIFLNMFKRYTEFAGKLADPLLNEVLGRLFVLFSFFHSDDSSHIDLSLSGNGELQVTGHENPRSLELYRKLRMFLNKNIAKTGVALVPFYTKKRSPGASMHFGASFPMSDNPAAMETDVLGRLQGMRRVHLVDASVFPTIPAGSYTLTIMGNAHRIGYEGA